MFGPLGLPELILIFVVALLLFGPRQMPHIGRSIGRALAEFRRASNEFKRTIEDEVAAEDVREVGREIAGIKRMGGAAGSSPTEPSTTSDERAEEGE